MDRHPGERAEKDGAAGGDSLRVLVVDDDDMVMETLRAMLEAMDMTPLSATSGERALALCERDMAHIDAIIMDVTMPGLNGIETATKIFKQGYEKLMVLSSGYNSVEIPESIKARVQFLKKPYSMDKLRSIFG